MKFVPRNVWDFLEVRAFYTAHPSAAFPAYEECASRYLRALSYYTAKIAEYSANLKKAGV